MLAGGYFAKMLKVLLHPFVLFWLGILISLGLLLMKKRRLARIGFYICFVSLFLTSVGIVTGPIVRSLEDRYPVYHPALHDTIGYDILVLGGGHIEDDRLPPNGQLNITALGRLVEGIRLFRLLPNSKLILSGYSPDGRTTQAEILQKTAELLGVESDDILLQKQPINTYEEAKFYRENYQSIRQLIVVTSGTHMPRAMKMFALFNLKPIAAPTNFLLRPINMGDYSLVPSTKNMDNLHTAIKEYLAMAVINFRY